MVRPQPDLKTKFDCGCTASTACSPGSLGLQRGLNFDLLTFPRFFPRFSHAWPLCYQYPYTVNIDPEILLPLVPLAHAEGTRSEGDVDGLADEQPTSPNSRIDAKVSIECIYFYIDWNHELGARIMTATLAQARVQPGEQILPTLYSVSNGRGLDHAAAPLANDWARLIVSGLGTSWQNRSGLAVLTWAIETFGTGLTIGTGLGASGIVLMDLALRINPDVDIFYIDTGYFFPETLQLIRRLEHHYQRSLRRVVTDLTIAQQEKRFGPALHTNDPNLCCQLRKVAPLKQALAGKTAWATALRQDQSSTRKNIGMVHWNERYQVVKLSPLAQWTEADIWHYIHDKKLPYNTLHDQHYPSIGCWPCTRPVNEGDDLRAGRWQGTEKKECGLHWELVEHVA
jgi:phosphoadenosine phosphosulfate reductase